MTTPLRLRRSLIRTSLLAITVTLALPGVSQAAESTSLVGGVVGSEISVVAATPVALSLSHASPATASTVVTVTSTQPSWTLSISDNNTGSNSGHILKTAGTGAAAVDSPLGSALQWSPDGASFFDLTGTPAEVGTGSLVGTKTVTYKQALGSTEDVSTGDAYQLTTKLTVL
jgi:hypothetical protein